MRLVVSPLQAAGDRGSESCTSDLEMEILIFNDGSIYVVQG